MEKKSVFDLIEFVEFPSNQYVKEVREKRQIVVHHTVSGEGIDGDVNWWLKTKGRIATAFIIGRDGVIRQNFGSKYYGWHLGIRSKVFRKFDLPHRELDAESIGIELDSWGGLMRGNNGSLYPVRWSEGSFKPDYRHNSIEDKNAVRYPDRFRGFEYYEAYTQVQIDSMAVLMRYLSRKYCIPLTYDQSSFFEQSRRALSGEKGMFSHVSYRTDKSDVHPQPNLVSKLRGLSYGE